jgi:hypothetical protein
MATQISDFSISERRTIAAIALMLQELPAAKQRDVVDSIASLAKLTVDEAEIAAGVFEIAAKERPGARRLILAFIASAESLDDLTSADVA